MITIKILDKGFDRYTIESDTNILGRKYDNNAEQIKVEKPNVEESSVCTIYFYSICDSKIVLHSTVEDKPISISSAITSYSAIKIGFSFVRQNGTRKNTETKLFKVGDAIGEKGSKGLEEYAICSGENEVSAIKFYNIKGDERFTIPLSTTPAENDNKPITSAGTKSYIDSINIQKGKGTNSLQQKASSKSQEFDNALFDITEIIPQPTSGATGKDSFEGNGNSIAYGELSNAFGRGTVAIGQRSHTEGTKTITTNLNAHAEGSGTLASGLNSHAEGYLTKASGLNSHAEGCGVIENNVAIPTEAGNYSHAEGVKTKATNFSHAEGDTTKANNYSHAEGYSTDANEFGHSEGVGTKTGKSTSIGWVELLTTNIATKTISLSEGQTLSVVSAICDKGAISTSVNGGTITATISGTSASAQNVVLVRIVYAINGSSPTPPAPTPPIQDKFNLATHSEGYMTEALSNASHAEGSSTHALGRASHAEGENTIAFGEVSHAGGIWTEAKHKGQTAIGRYNNNKLNTLFEVGNGSSSSNRSNAFEVYEDGHMRVGRGTTDGDDNLTIATKGYVDDNISIKTLPSATDLDTVIIGTTYKAGLYVSRVNFGTLPSFISADNDTYLLELEGFTPGGGTLVVTCTQTITMGKNVAWRTYTYETETWSAWTEKDLSKINTNQMKLLTENTDYTVTVSTDSYLGFTFTKAYKELIIRIKNSNGKCYGQSVGSLRAWSDSPTPYYDLLTNFISPIGETTFLSYIQNKTYNEIHLQVRNNCFYLDSIHFDNIYVGREICQYKGMIKSTASEQIKIVNIYKNSGTIQNDNIIEIYGVEA